ncbi:hypothetical protein DVS77_14490 [Mycolicibacterium moriokaense]|nr:hypothetical protein DVS77_14490 [Mycolicibacterium moriokaense]
MWISAATLSLKIIHADERRVAAIMKIMNSFTGVRRADMAQTLHVSGAFAAAAHHAAAAAITPRKPRPGTAIAASVRGTP